jgi:hypothetical protein
MKFQLGMDRGAENNVPSIEMPFWVDAAEMRKCQ